MATIPALFTFANARPCTLRLCAYRQDLMRSTLRKTNEEYHNTSLVGAVCLVPNAGLSPSLPLCVSVSFSLALSFSGHMTSKESPWYNKPTATFDLHELPRANKEEERPRLICLSASGLRQRLLSAKHGEEGTCDTSHAHSFLSLPVALSLTARFCVACTLFDSNSSHKPGGM